MGLKPVSVTQLNEYISRVLTTDPLLGNITVVGQISNLKYHSNGHLYFSIIDATSKINCFFAENYVRNSDVTLNDGKEVILNGYINVYKKGGTYTLFVRTVDVSGEGDLASQFQRMKERLDKEGLFSSVHKKAIPKFPKKIGVITSPTGAAVQDIIKTIKSRTHLTDVLIFPVLVQGEGAANDISNAIKIANDEFSDIDTLIIGRGGGSMEDLWAFNEEIVARAIYCSRIPVISAVGHETDFTISDFVADHRAATPTAAAELAVPKVEDFIDKIEDFKQDLWVSLSNKLNYSRLLINTMVSEMNSVMMQSINQYQHIIDTNKLYLEENNPDKVLEKGYSILETKSGHLVSSITEIEEGKCYSIKMKDGKVSFQMGNIHCYEEKS